MVVQRSTYWPSKVPPSVVVLSSRLFSLQPHFYADVRAQFQYDVTRHDQSTYMHWNGNFASLLFINNWEYTRNVTWAKEYAYPLLDGLNAWWACYLTKVPNRDGNSYIYHDHSITDPDEEHEQQKVPDPQIALAFIRRM